MTDELDPITIAGGGLAGLSLGIGLRSRGFPVSVIESGNYPRHRVCGEFISGVTPADLEKLAVPDLLNDAVANRTTSWHTDSHCFFESELPSPAMGISRFALDQILADQFLSAGGKLQTGTRFLLSESKTEGTVLAIGRPRRTHSNWIGLKAHLRNFEVHSDLEMHLGNGGYLGISRVENGIANACGLFKVQKSIKASKTELLLAYLEKSGLSKLAKRIRITEIVPESCLGVNAFELGHQLPKTPTEPDQMMLGDQFAIIGPFTGNGMSMAFQSAAVAVDPLVAYAKKEIGWAECCLEVNDELATKFRKRLGMSRLLHPFLTGGAQQKLLVMLGENNLLPFSLLFRHLRT